jgi:hypothetical protein
MATKLDILHYDSAFLIKFCTVTVQFLPKIAQPAGDFCTAWVQFSRISHCGGRQKRPDQRAIFEVLCKKLGIYSAKNRIDVDFLATRRCLNTPLKHWRFGGP